MNLVPPLRVLEDKAKAIADMLMEQGSVGYKDYDPTYLAILKTLRNGGKFQLLEDGHTIQVKTVVRDESGRVVGAQG